MKTRIKFLLGLVMSLFCLNQTFGAAAAPQMINQSIRTKILPGSTTVTFGFVIMPTLAGTGPGLSMRVLPRAVGPSLKQFGLPNAANSLRIKMFDSKGVAVPNGENAGWANNPAIVQVDSQVGAFPLAANSADAALIVNLAPGAYTAQVSDPSGVGGDVLIELYDVSRDGLLHFGNMSLLTNVLPAIIGIVTDGGGSKQLLIRAVGPGLAPFGLLAATLVADPKLTVFNGVGNKVTENDNWDPSLALVFAKCGAFPLPTGSKDSALLYLVPVSGPTSITVQGSNNSTTDPATGLTVLVEVYEASQ